MSMLDDTEVYSLVYLYIKFANLPQPAAIPWCEALSGNYVHEESTSDEMVTTTTPNLANEKGEALLPTEDNTPKKFHMKKAALREHLEIRLRVVDNPKLPDYGAIEDFVVQPAGIVMTREVFTFLAKYNI